MSVLLEHFNIKTLIGYIRIDHTPDLFDPLRYGVL